MEHHDYEIRKSPALADGLSSVNLSMPNMQGFEYSVECCVEEASASSCRSVRGQYNLANKNRSLFSVMLDVGEEPSLVNNGDT